MFMIAIAIQVRLMLMCVQIITGIVVVINTTTIVIDTDCLQHRY